MLSSQVMSGRDACVKQEVSSLKYFRSGSSESTVVKTISY